MGENVADPLDAEAIDLETNEPNILKDYRTSRSMSQQEAADRAEVSRQTWAAWEARTRPITLDQLDRIRATLGLEEAQVLRLAHWGSRLKREQVEASAIPSPDPA